MKEYNFKWIEKNFLLDGLMKKRLRLLIFIR